MSSLIILHQITKLNFKNPKTGKGKLPVSKLPGLRSRSCCNARNNISDLEPVALVNQVLNLDEIQKKRWNQERWNRSIRFLKHYVDACHILWLYLKFNCIVKQKTLGVSKLWTSLPPDVTNAPSPRHNCLWNPLLPLRANPCPGVFERVVFVGRSVKTATSIDALPANMSLVHSPPSPFAPSDGQTLAWVLTFDIAIWSISGLTRHVLSLFSKFLTEKDGHDITAVVWSLIHAFKRQFSRQQKTPPRLRPKKDRGTSRRTKFHNVQIWQEIAERGR